jgi:hypothetical protein
MTDPFFWVVSQSFFPNLEVSQSPTFQYASSSIKPIKCDRNASREQVSNPDEHLFVHFHQNRAARNLQGVVQKTEETGRNEVEQKA